MSKSFPPVLFAAVLAMIAAPAAQAALVTTLYGTGLKADGTPQVGGGTDAHYVVVENGLASALVLSNPPSTYFANDAKSKWIWQQADGLPVNVTRTFRTTFDLTGFDHTTASIAGLWGTDHTGEDILINGKTTGIALPGVAPNNYRQLHAFSILNGFRAGINTLDFRVRDTGAVSAFRAQLTGNAAVPEPGTLMLAALGLFAAAAGRARKPN